VVSAMKGTTDELLRIVRFLEDREGLRARNLAPAVIDCERQLPEQEHDHVRHEMKLLARDWHHQATPHPGVPVGAVLYDRVVCFEFCCLCWNPVSSPWSRVSSAQPRDGHITTLGRNSSDLTAFAHVVDASERVIWTDVDGRYTANAHESRQALFDRLNYEEAHALAVSGAKVLHPGVLPLASQSAMTVWVDNTFRPHLRGTRIGPAHSGGVA
jgi:aspartokinase